MWSKERFSSIKTTMWSTFSRLAMLVSSVTTASFRALEVADVL